MSVQNFNPYVGLRPFHADENLLFFGRDQQTLELLQRLHKHRFVAVVGGSGSGKSSLIRAGLIPALKGGYLVEDSSKWFITTMKPGSSPVYNLAETLLRQVDPDAQEEAISELVKKIKRERTSAILNLLSPLRKGKNANFFLLIDQFEELFRYSMEQQDSEKKTQAIDFVNLVLDLSRQKVLPFYVVLTMRSDFIGDCAQFRHLPEAMNKSQYLVPRITRQQLKKIIEGPARLYGGKFNPAMTTRLINDLEKVKDELPLLQHALMRMWDHEVNVDKSGELDFEDYKQIGGIENALSFHATEALEGMSKEDLEITKELFQALTAIDDNGRKIRRPLLLSDLRELTGASEEKLLGIIDNFIRDKRSFLIVEKAGEKDQVIDISHESLIRQWQTLNEWVEEENEAASYYLILADATHLHNEGKKDFLTGSELQLALEWQEKFKPSAVWANRYRKGFEESIAYLEASKNERARLLYIEKSRRKKLRILLGIIMGLITLFAVYAITSNIIIREQKEDLIEKSNKLVETSKYAEVQKENAIKEKLIADSAALKAQEQEIIARKARESADSAATEAKRQEIIALEAKDLAVSASSEAKRQENIAIKEKLIADAARSIATSQKIEATNKKKAFELHFQAKVLESKDPTTALRLEEEAIKLYKDYPEFKKAALNLINKNSFYKIIVEDTATVGAIDIHPDHKIILTGNDDGTVSVRDLNGTLITEFQAHEEAINYLKLSPNGKSIITSSARTFRLWDLSGKWMRASTATGRGNFTPESEFVFIRSENGDNYLVDFEGNPITSFRNSRKFTLVNLIYSPDGKSILTSSILKDDGSSCLLLWDLNGKIKRRMNTVAPIESMVFSPDGKFVLVGFWNADAQLWSLSRGKLLQEFKGHWGAVLSADFSSDGQSILTGSFDNTVRLWDLDGNMIKKFAGHEGEVRSVKFAPGGKSIISGAKDGTILSWNLEGVTATEIEGFNVAVRSVDYSPDGRYILTGSDQKAQLWDLKGNLVQTFDESGHGMVYSAVFAPEGPSILTGTANGTIRLWNLDGTLKREIARYGDAVRSVAFAPDGESILTGSWDKTVKLWDLQGILLNEFTLDKGINTVTNSPQGKLNAGITSVAFSPDGKKVLAGTFGISHLWDLKGNLIAEFKEPSELFVNGVAFSPDGQFVLTGSNDHSARLWNLKGEIIRTFSGPEGAIRSVAFAPDGKSIMTGSAGGIARIWDLDGNILEEFQGNNGTVFSVAYAPDNKSIVIGSQREAFLMKRIQLEEFLKSTNIEPLSEAQKKEYKIKE